MYFTGVRTDTGSNRLAKPSSKFFRLQCSKILDNQSTTNKYMYLYTYKVEIKNWNNFPKFSEQNTFRDCLNLHIPFCFHIQYIFDKCSMLQQTQSRQNHSFYRNLHCKEFVANVFFENIGIKKIGL